MRYFFQISVTSSEDQNFNLKENCKSQLQLQISISKLQKNFYQKLGSEEPNSGLHQLVPTLDNVHLHLAKVQSLN